MIKTLEFRQVSAPVKYLLWGYLDFLDKYKDSETFDKTEYVGRYGAYRQFDLMLRTEEDFLRATAEELLQGVPADTWTPILLESLTGYCAGYLLQHTYYNVSVAHKRCLNCKHALLAHVGT